MADGLTLQDVREIQGDAEKNTNRLFRDAKEDNGWEPTPTPGAADPEATGTTEADLEHTSGESSDASLNELRAQAKELNLPAGGTKADLTARIAEAQKTDETNNTEGKG